MKIFKETLIDIYRTDRSVIVLMIFNLLFSIGLLIFSFISLNPDTAVFKIGYGDIGGYRDGTWMDMLAFPSLAILFGVFHNLLALRIFHKRGGGMTKFFLVTTTGLIFGTLLVLIRLLGEG